MSISCLFCQISSQPFGTRSPNQFILNILFFQMNRLLDGFNHIRELTNKQISKCLFSAANCSNWKMRHDIYYARSIQTELVDEIETPKKLKIL